jgi:hypothetical protein
MAVLPNKYTNQARLDRAESLRQSKYNHKHFTVHTADSTKHEINRQLHAASPTMAGAQKLYPRATVKKIVKAHSRRNLSKNVDVLVRLLVDASAEYNADRP